jgi:ABC-type protease/lipase transport system fused ATPase/permease subunit
MTIFKTAILPYQHIFKDLKNNISLRELSFLALYILFLLYNWQIIDRVVAYGNKDTLLILRIIVFVQELLILPVFAFCLKKVYLTTIYSESFNSKISLTPNIEQSSNRTFRLFSLDFIL